MNFPSILPNLALSSVSLLLLAVVAEARPQQDLSDPDHTEVVGYLADRSTRDLVDLLADWRVAIGAAKDALEPEIESLAQERFGYLEETMRRDPDRALGLFLSSSDRADVDSIVAGCTTQPVTLQGILGAHYAESFDSGSFSGPFYDLADPNGMTIDLWSPDKVLDQLTTGSEIIVTGNAGSSDLVVGTAPGAYSVVALPAPQPEPAKLYLIVRVGFTESSGAIIPPIASVSDIVNVYMIDPKNIVDYYDEVSFSKLDIVLQLFNDGNLLVLNEPPTSNFVHIRDCVLDALEQTAGFDATNYYGLIMFLDWTSVPTQYHNRASEGKRSFQINCDGAGASTGPNGSLTEFYDLAVAWMGGTGSNQFYSNAHEVGHTLGSGHAGFWECQQLNTFDSSCVCTYGDPVSVMGAMNAGSGTSKCTNSIANGQSHWTGVHKLEIGQGFIPAGQVKVIPPGTLGLYCLKPISQAGPHNCSASSYTPAQILKMPRGALDSLYLEFRYPTGGQYETTSGLGAYGASQGGGVLYVRPSSRESNIVDWKTSPAPGGGAGSNPVLSTAAMHKGDTFYDECTGITISIDDIIIDDSPAHMHVTVTPPVNPRLDNTPPTNVSIVSPMENDDVTGIITVTMQADDETALKELELRYFDRSVEDYVPCPLINCTSGSSCSVLGLTSASCSVSFDTGPLPAGPLSLKVIARDFSEGYCPNEGESGVRKVNVVKGLSDSAPDVAMSAPLPNASIVTPSTLDVIASDNDGIASVEYWVDPDYSDLCGVGELHNGIHPPNCKYHAYFPAYSRQFPDIDNGRGAFLVGLGDATQLSDTVDNLPPGNYTAWARCTDLPGVGANSDTIAFSVAGVGGFSISLPFDNGYGISSGSTVTIAPATTADPNEIGYVDFFVNGLSIGRVEDAPYTLDWTAPAEGGAFTIRVDSFGIGGRTASDSRSVTVN